MEGLFFFPSHINHNLAKTPQKIVLVDWKIRTQEDSLITSVKSTWAIPFLKRGNSYFSIPKHL